MEGKEYDKNIEKEIDLIENLLIEESFTVMNEGFPIHDSQFKLSKNNNNFDFCFQLKNTLHPNQITFKKLGLNENFKISSNGKKYIIPPKSITKISAKSLTSSDKIKGKLSTLYSELFPLELKSFFRLSIKIETEHFTTFFLGSKYSCNKIHYSLGLIEIEIENKKFHIYRHRNNQNNYLVIECLDKTNFIFFRSICETTLKSIGFLKGNWYRGEHFFFSYHTNNFVEPLAFYYCFLGKSLISNREIINPQEFRSFSRVNFENNSDLKSLLFPEQTLSRFISEVKSKPELERTLELILEGSEIKSPLIKCSIFSVGLETIAGLIHSENKSYFKPIKKTKKLNSLLTELQSIIDSQKGNFSELEYEVISKKTMYLNAPSNKDKFLLAYSYYNIHLPKELESLLNNRNKYLHGKTPYEERDVKSKIKELNLEADRLHMLVSILILKYIGYRGHIKNYAGYNLLTHNHYEEDNIEINESIFYLI